MKSPLVIMAAGLGSRFGGVKQLARVGSHGQAILDFSIADGLEAGFDEIVMIVRGDIEADVRSHIETQHGPDLPVVFVRQDTFGPQRAKPWGTLHAVLSAAPVIDGPFTVINADDYYGPQTYAVAIDRLRGIAPGQATNVAFDLGRTVPPAGQVSRGICEVDSDGRLKSIVETHDCERRPDGRLWAGGQQVPEDTPASMNVWCFDKSVLEPFRQVWHNFYEANAEHPGAEAQLPTVVGQLMENGTLDVDVRPSPESWIGITNPDDLDMARTYLADR